MQLLQRLVPSSRDCGSCWRRRRRAPGLDNQRPPCARCLLRMPAPRPPRHPPHPPTLLTSKLKEVWSSAGGVSQWKSASATPRQNAAGSSRLRRYISLYCSRDVTHASAAIPAYCCCPAEAAPCGGERGRWGERGERGSGGRPSGCCACTRLRRTAAVGGRAAVCAPLGCGERALAAYALRLIGCSCCCVLLSEEPRPACSRAGCCSKQQLLCPSSAHPEGELAPVAGATRRPLVVAVGPALHGAAPGARAQGVADRGAHGGACTRRPGKVGVCSLRRGSVPLSTSDYSGPAYLREARCTAAPRGAPSTRCATGQARRPHQGGCGRKRALGECQLCPAKTEGGPAAESPLPAPRGALRAHCTSLLHLGAAPALWSLHSHGHLHPSPPPP